MHGMVLYGWFLMSGPITKLPGPNDALILAWADSQRLAPTDRLFTRYIWVRNGNALDAKAVSFAMNVVSRATPIARPQPISKDSLLLLRLDVRAYAPQKADLEEWLRLWEELQFDPRFSLLITQGTLKALDLDKLKGVHGWVVGTANILENSEPYRDETTGRTVQGRWVSKRVNGLMELKDVRDIEVIRLPGQFLDQTIYNRLVNLLGTQAPVVSDDYFLGRVLSAIKGKNAYKVIYGGLYYDLAGTKRVNKEKQEKGTDEDKLLEQLGVGNVEKGVDAKAIFDKLRSDQRVAVFRSGVTGKPRQIEFFRTLSGRIDAGTGLISFTHDLADDDVDIDTHPVANLLNFTDKAREVIYERRNGLHGYALFNGQGALQDEAPFDVVLDHTIPAPFTQRLQPAISCISCHEAEGSDGWKKVTNDVKQLVKPDRKLDIFGDTSQKKELIPDTLDRLSLYQGEPERALVRGRDDYASSVLRATGPWPASTKGQADVVQHAGTRVVAVWRGYFYDLVTAGAALRELGISAPGKDPKVVLDELLKPDKRAVVNIPELELAVVPEDPRIGALLAGIGVNRTDFDLVYPFMQDRANYYLTRLGKMKPINKNGNGRQANKSPLPGAI
jgi:hypothetical protein